MLAPVVIFGYQAYFQRFLKIEGQIGLWYIFDIPNALPNIKEEKKNHTYVRK